MSTAPATVGVLGASGGLGTSTLAVALGVRAACAGIPTTVVDGHVGGGGLDVTAAAEHRAGIRWGDLAAARGGFDGAQLRDHLPVVAGAHVLSAGPAGAPPPPGGVVEAAVRSLAALGGLVVLDLPRRGPLHEALVPACETVLLVCGLSPRRLADAWAMTIALRGTRAPSGAATPDVLLVVRTDRRGRDLAAGAAEHLGLALGGLLEDEPAIAVGDLRGETPGTVRRSRLAASCAHLLARTTAAPSLEEAS